MKPLRETKIGKFLSGKGLDHLLEEVGAVVPGVKTLDELKDLVLGDPDTLTSEDKQEFLVLHRLTLEEMDREMSSIADARDREKEFVTVRGHIDWFMTIFGCIILACFVYTVVISTTGAIPTDMREIFIESRAAVRDIVLAIAAYYWGSSAGSRMKELRPKS
ncbi:MAG TPA: hypothetical protein PLR06_01230 [Cyclobacteriaceae bacterium]|nr:hypothetical protein [Cyclobacteriaceae bacterium]